MHPSFSPYFENSEKNAVEALLQNIRWDENSVGSIRAKAAELIEAVRTAKRPSGQLESFLQDYSLNTEEGLALMALAEALLRIPDKATANALIRDKVAAAHWLEKEGHSKDWVVKAAGVGLYMSRKTLESVISRLGEPIIREAMVRAMQIMGKQFVLGQDIADAMKNAQSLEKKGYRMSYDMLGEGARTAIDATRYFESYSHAIRYIGEHAPSDPKLKPGISVKLSALHPRYSFYQKQRCVKEITEQLRKLCRMAAGFNMALTVDAEESERLNLSVEIITAIIKDPEFKGWDGFGLAVQAYHKATLPLIHHMAETARAHGKRLQMRLVKGAYWDSEIKRAQVMGLSDFPVYTRKYHTDLSYLVCAQAMFENADVLYPMLATHNAYSVAAILEMAKSKSGAFEFQRLFGMGEALHNQVVESGQAVSVYAPVGPHHDLLAYLVRRLLENGANSSFVNLLLNPDAPVEKLVGCPVDKSRLSQGAKHPRILLPKALFEEEKPMGRVNSEGLDLYAPEIEAALDKAYKALKRPVQARSLTGFKRAESGTHLDVFNPVCTDTKIGSVETLNEGDVDAVFQTALKAFDSWHKTQPEERAVLLERTADLLEERKLELMALLVHEGGKTWPDALAEQREAVDFLRYYAAQGREVFAPRTLPGPTGERNEILSEGRGIFVCISPWNFPLAIFTGQIAAALMAGNCVIAKPAEQTPLIAHEMIKLMHRAGFNPSVLQLVLGDGEIGAALTAHKGVAGVCFTGSTAVARSINQTLAAKDGAIVPLIAETGGQNAMIVDSSALPEQVIDDVIISAFGSAGQRCSALRVLYVQEDNAERLLDLLKGAMAELKVGDPAQLSSDIGPIIDEEARGHLIRHRSALDEFGALIAEVPMDPALKEQGTFFAPCAYEIQSIRQLHKEVFGPILHVVRYKASKLDQVLDDIHSTGYGLTLGVHTRIEGFYETIATRMQIGNIYVNRSMIGAVVGSQPFGGMGLSGTGPKAGGPHYLPRFAMEKVVSINTAAAGGNASLVSLEE